MSEIYTDSTTARYKETYTLSSQSQLSEKNSLFTRDKYDLTGWIDSNGTQYSLGQTINPEGEVTISAQWLGKQYNVILNKNGGTCKDLTSYRYEVGADLPTDWTKTGYTFVGWKNNSELTGDNFTKISSDEYGDKEFWAANSINPLENQLYFEAQEENSTIKLENVAGTYKTSTNGTDWDDYALGTLCTLTNVGDKIYFSARSTNDTCWNDDYNTKFSMSGKIAAEGNIQYLIDSTGECLSVPDSCYFYMFYDCTSLTQAPELPATTLANECYSYMFYDCTSLTQAPELPATTLANYCYYYMFSNCNHLSVTTDSTKQGAYQILSAESTTASNWGTDMFTGTAGDFTGTPTTGTPYYCWGI